jgi:hypothetical protein
MVAVAGFALDHDHNVGAVVVGFDRHINYYKIQYAQLCINENKGCEFIATNLDAVTHLTDAQEWAGNGSMAGAIRGCTGRDPTVVGKPAPLMIDYLCAKYNLKPDRICMVIPSLPAPPFTHSPILRPSQPLSLSCACLLVDSECAPATLACMPVCSRNPASRAGPGGPVLGYPG